MIETKSFDLALPMVPAGEVVSFTAANDACWSGMVDLPPWGQLPLDPGARSDLYILQGELIDNVALAYSCGAFISASVNGTFAAGPEGARLFTYRDRSSAPHNEHRTVKPGQLDWHTGGTPGMKVASLVGGGHSLMLVSWVCGTRMRFHRHPQGEEIFVLKGELMDQGGHYPAGTWQRLHPGTGHAPYSETDTLILLRNGHLHSDRLREK